MASEHLTELRLLGALEAVTRSETGDRRLGKGKPVALLAYLSLAPGRRVSRERLATLLWSDGTNDAARQNLRQTLWYLKRRLGEVVVADDDSVALISTARTDVEVFVAAAAEDRFGDAVASYTGEFVPDFAAPGAAAFEEWAELERRRLRATYVGCAEGLSRMYLGTGRASEAVQLAKRARTLAPDDPTASRLLLECLIAARDLLGLAAAVAQLEGEVERDDLDPDPAIRSLLRASKRMIGSGDVEPGRAETPEQSLVPDLIGREAEFRSLVDAWEGARRGRGRAVLVTGAAGLGKTRLLADFAARVISTRGRTVQVRAHPGNRTIAGSLAAQIAEALAALPGAAAISTGSASVLVALSPLLASSFPGAEPDRATGEDALRRRAAALGDLLGVLCESTPIALLVDDAHWADSESLRLVSALRARVEGAKSLLVVASRIPDALRHHIGTVEELALQPLDVAGVAEFVGRLASLPTESWSRGFVPRLHEISHGIPLLLIDSLQRLVESGALERREGQWFATSATALADAMPPGGALQARLATLDGAERTALVRLATLGRPVRDEELTIEETGADWGSVLAALERRSFVTRSGDRVSTWHDEVARTVLEQVSADERLAAHAWVARLLSARATSLGDHRLAAMHASRAADEQLVQKVWMCALHYARVQGDARPTTAIAREILGAEVSMERTRAILRSTPWSQRLSPRTRTGMMAVASIALLATVGSYLQTPATFEGIVLFAEYIEDSTHVVRYTLPPLSEWQVAAPLEGQLVKADESPVPLDGNIRALVQVPGRTEWIGVRTYPDSGGDEWVRVRQGGKVTRLGMSPGDDGFPIPIGDGTEFLATTRRFDRVFHQSEIVRVDSAGSVIEQIASSPEDEGSALPSPDGTRISFERQYSTQIGPDEICISDLDGSNAQCAWEGLDARAARNIGWTDATTVLLLDGYSRALYRLDVRAGRATQIGVPACQLDPIVGTPFVRTLCVDAQTKEEILGIAPLNAPSQVRVLVANGKRLVGHRRALVAVNSAPVPRYLSRVALIVSDTLLPQGTGGTAVVTGADQTGIPMEVPYARFQSSDSSVLRVTSDGALEARREGSVWIISSAGGWRRDSIRIRVGAGTATTETVLEEDWRGGIDADWHSFGAPAPILGILAGARVLMPNGDGVYASGVISRDSWSPRRGLSLEFDAWLPVSRPKMQSLRFALIEAPSPAALAQWQRQEPLGNVRAVNICSSGLPSGEGMQALTEYGLMAGSSAELRREMPDFRMFYGERWHRIGLRVRADGKCELAIDGATVLASTAAMPLPERAAVLVSGISLGTTVAVRGVRLLRGTATSR